MSLTATFRRGWQPIGRPDFSCAGDINLSHPLRHSRGRRPYAPGRRVCSLTHAEPRCVDSTVLWSRAVLEGILDVRSGLTHLPADKRRPWQAYLDAAETEPLSSFNPNGFTVTALQAPWASI